MSLINVVENEKLTKNLQKFSGEIVKLLNKIKVAQDTFPNISEGNFSVLHDFVWASKSGEDKLIESITDNAVVLDILSPILSPRMMGFLNKEFSLNFALNPSLDTLTESKSFLYNFEEGITHPYYFTFLPALQKAQATGLLDEKEMIALAFTSFYSMAHHEKKEQAELFLHNTYLKMQYTPKSHAWFFKKLSKHMKFPYVNYHEQEAIIPPTLPQTGFVFAYPVKEEEIESTPVIICFKDMQSINLHEYARQNPSIQHDMDEVMKRDTSGQLVRSKVYENQVFFIPYKFISFPKETSFKNRVFIKGGYEMNFRQKFMNQMLNPSELIVTTGSLVRIGKFVGYINEITVPKLYEKNAKTGTFTLQLYTIYSDSVAWNPKVDGTNMHTVSWDISPEEMKEVQKASDRDVAVFLHFCGV